MCVRVSWTYRNCKGKWITITPNTRIQWIAYRHYWGSKNKLIRFESSQSPTLAFFFEESKLTLLIWSGLTMLVFEKNCRRFFISVITRSWPSSNIMMIACGMIKLSKWLKGKSLLQKKKRFLKERIWEWAWCNQDVLNNKWQNSHTLIGQEL